MSSISHPVLFPPVGVRPAAAAALSQYGHEVFDEARRGLGKVVVRLLMGRNVCVMLDLLLICVLILPIEAPQPYHADLRWRVVSVLGWLPENASVVAILVWNVCRW